MESVNSSNIKKGFKNNDGFVKQINQKGFNDLKKECYLYKVSKNDFIIMKMEKELNLYHVYHLKY